MTQLRANGFSEAEYPLIFLEFRESLDDFPLEGQVLEEEEAEAEAEAEEGVVRNRRTKIPQPLFLRFFVFFVFL